jgi:hypothetical protein
LTPPGIQAIGDAIDAAADFAGIGFDIAESEIHSVESAIRDHRSAGLSGSRSR